jgi:Arc/MetJ-type ribon-helix-helix transcriptional regulator
MDLHEHMRALERLGEQYYDAMYDSRFPTGEYASAKDAFRDAIALARQLGETEIEKRLEARLAHIKAVFRSQFT